MPTAATDGTDSTGNERVVAERIDLSIVGSNVVLGIDHHFAETVPGRWLRDHGDDPASIDPRSRQRVLDTFALDSDVTPLAIDIDGPVASVRWSDEATTTHELAALAEVALHRREPGPAIGRPLAFDPARRPWAEPPQATTLPAEVIDDDDRWPAALEKLHRDGWLWLDGVEPGPAPLERLAARIGYPRRTIFGDIWGMEPGADRHLDSAYDTVALDPHTDGSYSHDAPGVIVFSLQEREGSGGESVLVDGFAAARDFAAAEPEAADLLTRFEIRGRYVEPGVDLAADRPPLRLDHAGVLRQVTFNNYDRAPVLPVHGWVDKVIDAYAAFRAFVVDPTRALELGWEPGRMLVIDNWRLLHGRTAYTGDRRFLGMYTNHEDLESAWRLRGLI